MKLETIYNLKAIPIIRAFTTEFAKFYGASEKEVRELEFAVEEAAEHIIVNFPQDDSKTAVFEIICQSDEANHLIRVIMRNKGLPIDKDNLPVYKAENPEDNIEGLKFFFLEKFTDNFSFVNCGQDGWNTILEKKIFQFAMPRENKISRESKELAVVSGKTTVSLALPEDAYEITKLAYYTYRYSYAKNIFYYPEMLKEAIENGNVISFVAKNDQNQIVAHGAYIRTAQCREISEVGALMSRPEYRKSMAIFKVVKHIVKYPFQEHVDIKIFYSNLVTAHTGSQRITKLFNFIPLAFKLSAYDQPEFIDIRDIGKQQRETLLHAIWVPRDIKDIKVRLHVPQEHKEICEEIFENVPFSSEILCNQATKMVKESLITVKKNEVYNLAVIRIDILGEDWFFSVRRLTKELKTKKFATIHLEIASFLPIPPDLNERLMGIEYFFSGLLPNTPEKWLLLYTLFNNQEFDFEQIKLVDERAIKLRNYVKKCYEVIDES